MRDRASSRRPGLAALDALVERHRLSGLSIVAGHLGAASRQRLSPGSRSSAAYRILQESLTNAARHGDRMSARRLKKTLEFAPEDLAIEVRGQPDRPRPDAQRRRSRDRRHARTSQAAWWDLRRPRTATVPGQRCAFPTAVLLREQRSGASRRRRRPDAGRASRPAPRPSFRSRWSARRRTARGRSFCAPLRAGRGADGRPDAGPRRHRRNPRGRGPSPQCGS